MLRRYVDAYGTRCRIILSGAHSLQDMGEHFGHQLYAVEVAYLIKHEWVNNVEDLLWRRSKLGLFINSKQKTYLQSYLNSMKHREMNAAS